MPKASAELPLQAQRVLEQRTRSVDVAPEASQDAKLIERERGVRLVTKRSIPGQGLDKDRFRAIELASKEELRAQEH